MRHLRTGPPGHWFVDRRGISVGTRFGTFALDTPAPAVRLLSGVLDRMAYERGVALGPLHNELTTHQAAELLQVSRTHLMQLLDKGRIPSRRVGSHCRVRVEDVLAYRRETETHRRKALDELTARDQELGLQ